MSTIVYGCLPETRVFSEKRSGRQTEGRPELQACRQFIRDGHTLVISRLDRMARSVLDLVKIMDLLRQKGVVLKVLDQSIDTGTPEGKLMFSLLATFAEFENDIQAQRQVDGIAKAKEKGVAFGWKRALTPSSPSESEHFARKGSFRLHHLLSVSP